MSRDNQTTPILQPASPPPADYPTQPEPDTFCDKPFNTRYNARKTAYLDFCTRNPSPPTFRAPLQELARLAAGNQPHLGCFYAALDHIEQRLDGADYLVHAMLRLLYHYKDHSRLDKSLIARSEEVLLSFKYWPSEPGIDSMCTWTENHQILFAAADFLAGQMFPDVRFSNAFQTGRQKMQSARNRILRWLDLRFRSGFSAWLSPASYDDSLLALINLIDLCKDEEIVKRARMVTDLLFYDIAINSFKGLPTSTHGIGDFASNTSPASSQISDTIKLVFGLGTFSAEHNLSAPVLALSKHYQLPRVIYEIANHQPPEPVCTRQRTGIRIRENQRWHLDFKNMDDRMALLGAEVYAHPLTIRFITDTLNKYNLWDNPRFQTLNKYRPYINALSRIGLLRFATNLYRMDLSRTYLKEVNTTTCRTPYYMLSSAQDFRPGYGGHRQHVWQATLGPQAVCFTTHPARNSGSPPNYWDGNGSLPRVAQINNVLIAIYNIYDKRALELKNRLLLTHAWLPQQHFDQIVEQNGWVFARYQDAYLALRSQQPYEWHTAPEEKHPHELKVHGKQNIWICELGCKPDDGSFEDFIQHIAHALITFDRNSVVYHSPTQGQIWFGWQGQLRRNGKPLPLDDYPRYDNPYSQVAFDDDHVLIEHEKHDLSLTWSTLERRASRFS